ncbi:MAG: ComEC/Rec2 family competence protein [Planctomycetia bacterium]|nr:ComEC/Rec2 family competence protein [Planctomycetia bacterium]
MTRTTAPRATSNVPMTPYFLATAAGVLFNHYHSVSVGVWSRVFLVAVLGVVACQLLSILILPRYAQLAQLIDLPPCLVMPNYPDVNPARRLWLNVLFCFRQRLCHGAFWLFLAFFCLAGARAELFYHYYPSNDLGRYVADDSLLATLKLKVISAPNLFQGQNLHGEQQETTSTTNFIARAYALRQGQRWQEVCGKVAVSVQGDARALQIGDLLVVTGRLWRPQPPSNPYERDSVFYYRAQRITSRLFIQEIDAIQPEENVKLTFREHVARLLQRLRERAAAILYDRLCPRNAAIAAGMTFGFRNDVDRDSTDAFRRSGVIHLLAISGLHVALVVGACVCFLRRIIRNRVMISVLTIFLVFFYVGLTDVRTPVVRAAVIIIIMSFGVILRRRGATLNSLLFAATLFLFYNPCELFQPGAQLSFLASGALLWTSGQTILEHSLSNDQRRRAIAERHKLKEERRQALDDAHTHGDSPRATRRLGLLRSVLGFLRTFLRTTRGKMRSVFIASTTIWIVGSPLILKTTNLFTPIAIVANLLIWAPAAVSLLLAFTLVAVGFLAQAIGGVSYLTLALGWVTDKSFDLFLYLVDLMGSTSRGAFYLPNPPQWTLWLFYLPLIFWTLYKQFRPKARTLWTLLLIWSTLVVLTFSYQHMSWRSSQALQYKVFSIGHGIASLGVMPDGRVFLYDCGSLDDSEHAAQIVAKNLWNMGRVKIDAAILSHADFDHFGGVATLMELVQIDKVVVSPAMFQKSGENLDALRDLFQSKGVEVFEVTAYDNLGRYGFPEMTVLHPKLDAQGKLSDGSNENSVVLSIEYLGRKALLPGDLDADEPEFIATPTSPYALVLAPHHGGKSINAEELYQWSQPRVIAVSGGNRIRNRQMEAQLHTQGICTLHTADDGMIQFQIRPTSAGANDERGEVEITTFKTKKNIVLE